MENLIQNAIDFRGEKQSNSFVKISTKQENYKLVIRVVNNGTRI